MRNYRRNKKKYTQIQTKSFFDYIFSKTKWGIRIDNFVTLENAKVVLFVYAIVHTWNRRAIDIKEQTDDEMRRSEKNIV